MWQFLCSWLWWFLEKERICFRKDDLSVLESGECQSLVQVWKRSETIFFPHFASLAGASIFKSLPSVWQQLERDFHCRLGRGKGSLLFWNTSSWRNPLRLITETLGYQHITEENMNYVTSCRKWRDLWTRQRQFTCGTIGAKWFRLERAKIKPTD